MLIAALGCNLAWGLIDAAMYLLWCEPRRRSRAGRSRRSGRRSRRTLRTARSPGPCRPSLRMRSARTTSSASGCTSCPSARSEAPRLAGRLSRAAAAVFLLVFLATLPVALPFVVLDDPQRALGSRTASPSRRCFLRAARSGSTGVTRGGSGSRWWRSVWGSSASPSPWVDEMRSPALTMRPPKRSAWGFPRRNLEVSRQPFSRGRGWRRRTRRWRTGGAEIREFH